MSKLRNRNRFRFSVKTVLVFISCIASLLAVYRLGTRHEGVSRSAARLTEAPPAAELGLEIPSTNGSQRQTNAHLYSLKKPYLDATSLHEAVEALNSELRRRDVNKFASLVTERIVRQAIPKALKEYEAGYSNSIDEATSAEQVEARKRHQKLLNESVKPTLAKIVEHGEWPPGSYFQHWGGDNDSSVFRVHMNVMHDPTVPFENYSGFSLPIIRAEIGQAD